MMIYDERNFEMIYKTVVVDYAPKTKKMAALIEEKANEMLKNGYELVSCFSIPTIRWSRFCGF